MTEFKVGQRVRVEFEGTIPEAGGGMEASIMAGPNGVKVPYSDRLYLSNLTGVKITLADPQNWPPQPGDIWEADGKEWFARRPRHQTMFLVPDHATEPALTASEFKGLNPVLVRRRGQ